MIRISVENIFGLSQDLSLLPKMNFMVTGVPTLGRPGHTFLCANFPIHSWQFHPRRAPSWPVSFL